MISNLELKNFKSWKETNSIKLSKISGFFGTNSSGKTSLLQSLLLLKQTTESPDRKQVLGFDGDYVKLGSFQDAVYNHDLKSSLYFEFDLNLTEELKILNPETKNNVLFQSDKIKFSCEIAARNDGSLFLQYFSYNIGDIQFNIKRRAQKNQYSLTAENIGDKNISFKFKRTQGRVWDLPPPFKFYGFPDQVRAYFQNASFLSDLELQIETAFTNLFYLGPLREYPQREYNWSGTRPSDMGYRGEKAIEAILSAKKQHTLIDPGFRKRKIPFEEYIANWLKQLNLIESFETKQLAPNSNIYQVLVKKSKNSPSVLLTDVGFGVSQILPVITLCFFAPPGSTLLIEQPEIHLHPMVQAGLADVFIDAIKKNNIQIILESHSEHLLRRFQRRIAEEKINEADLALFFCSNTNGNSQLTELDINLFGNIKNWPEKFFGDEMGEIVAMQKAITKRKHQN